jgi:glycopeptide antibiotics resistance protein
LCYIVRESMKTKSLTKTVLVVYLLVLLWLVLFKFSSNPFSVLANYQTRTLNLIPFAGISRTHLDETLYNIIAFIPFGLFMNVSFKRIDFWRKLAYICAFSIAIEITQFIFAIGRTDINDVITNTLGGLIGLLLYRLGDEYVDNEKLDKIIIVAGAILLIILLFLRTLFFRVSYHSGSSVHHD